MTALIKQVAKFHEHRLKLTQVEVQVSREGAKVLIYFSKWKSLKSFGSGLYTEEWELPKY